MGKVLKSIDMNKCLGCFTCMQICAAVNHKSHSLSKAGIRIRTIGGMSTNSIAIFCHGCQDPTCAKACPSLALEKREGGGVNLDSNKCIGCRTCEKVCTARAINFDEVGKKPIICHHCGVCAKFCPHGCLNLVDVQTGED